MPGVLQIGVRYICIVSNIISRGFWKFTSAMTIDKKSYNCSKHKSKNNGKTNKNFRFRWSSSRSRVQEWYVLRIFSGNLLWRRSSYWIEYWIKKRVWSKEEDRHIWEEKTYIYINKQIYIYIYTLYTYICYDRIFIYSTWSVCFAFSLSCVCVRGCACLSSFNYYTSTIVVLYYYAIQLLY